MNRIYLVAIRWVDTAYDAKSIDDALTTLNGDWLRYNGNTWFVSCAKSAYEVSTLVRSRLKAGDSIIVTPMDGVEFAGNAPKMAWDWFDRNAQNYNAMFRSK